MGRAADEPLGVQPLGVLGARRKEDVERETLARLLCQLVRAAEGRPRRRVDLRRTSVREAAASTVAGPSLDRASTVAAATAAQTVTTTSNAAARLTAPPSRSST